MAQAVEFMTSLPTCPYGYLLGHKWATIRVPSGLPTHDGFPRGHQLSQVGKPIGEPLDTHKERTCVPDCMHVVGPRTARRHPKVTIFYAGGGITQLCT